ncbi:hypothetical protein BFX40_02435 [Mesorhizobium sp. SEMIA 3007]|uniref:recombinase family protein n=1 Tax=Mesorhizobium sp. SEMIA 3007 TaxID=1862350 RepID=UPI00083D75C8|nr:recombinase family protein [Mesorhizobium sp. SEMIA 3007]ODA91857.1 hypothetical protein BFX40_02435 [Mesorhizobium sp. SEMIA 3007]
MAKRVKSSAKGVSTFSFADIVGTSKVRKPETIASRRARLRGKDILSSSTALKTIRVALYLRVSSDKSVQSNLSIPDQEAQLRALCKQEGWIIVAVYIEEGVSAKTAARPQFQRMIADSQSQERPFEKILIHNTSRFARSSSDYAIYEKLLVQHNIEIVSVSQTFAKDAGGMISKRISNLFDEFHSLRSAVDSIRARRRMVEIGHWPGGPPLFGYRLIPAGDNPSRKWVAIRHEERGVVERIYSMALYGDGEGPPLGLQAIAKWLNKRGYRTRDGARWGGQAIHKMLTNPAYYGDYYWFVNPSENEFIEDQDPILMGIPAIVARQMFEEVQLLLERRNPKMHGAKLISSPLLLAGIARCKCGASMTLGTGTGKLGVVYRYYRCSADSRGLDRCSGPRIPEGTLDSAVLDSLKDRILDENRLSDLLIRLSERDARQRTRADGKIPEFQARMKAAETALQGIMATAKLAPSITSQPTFQRELELVSSELAAASHLMSEALAKGSERSEVTPARIAFFRSQMEELLFGSNRAVAKIYLATIVAQVEVGERFVRIHGRVSDLRDAVSATGQSEGGVGGVPGVRRYVRRWRRGRDTLLQGSEPLASLDIRSFETHLWGTSVGHRGAEWQAKNNISNGTGSSGASA